MDVALVFSSLLRLISEWIFLKKKLPDYPALSPVKHIIREEMSHYFKINNGVVCMDK